MNRPAPPLSIGGIRDATVVALRPNWRIVLAVAAPFTVLIDMTLAVLGPPQPRAYADFTPQAVALFGVLPLAIYSIAELAVIRLTLHPDTLPRDALRGALALAPGYLLVLAVALAGFSVGAAFLLLPGVYLWARLFLAGPVAVAEKLTPLATLKRSWQLTGQHAGTIFGFLVLAILFTLGVLFIASGIGSVVMLALKSVGLAAFGGFGVNLVGAAASMALTIACSAASAVIYRQLR